MSDPQAAAPDAGAPSSTSLKTNVSLAAMMFLQYMLVAVWFVQLSQYLTKANMDGYMKSLTLSSMAIGAMASPIVCALAGRYFASQKVLAAVNLATAALLFGAGWVGGMQSASHILTLVFILLAMVCYMPTWPLTSSIAMSHSDPKNFPRIRTFGTIGWVASGLFSLVFAGLRLKEKAADGTETATVIWEGFVKAFDGTNLPLYCGAGIALAAAVLNILTLPDTPPSNDGSKFSIAKALGLDAFKLLKDRNFLVFITGSFVAMIAFVLYFSYGAQFLGEKKAFAEIITITMNWGQAGEMVLMFLTTVVLAKAGVKKALLIGLLAMTARYGFLYLGNKDDIAGLIIAGILVHGFIFGWFFTGGQVYTDQKAPKELRAQAQGMSAFLIWGVGVLAGTFIYGELIKRVTTRQTVDDPTGVGDKIVETVNWQPLFGGTAILSLAVFVFFLLFFKDEQTKAAADDSGVDAAIRELEERRRADADAPQ